jgi:hypothetical protein
VTTNVARTTLLGSAIALLAIALTACGGSSKPKAAATTTTVATTSTTAPEGSTTTGANDVWTQTATAYRGQNGKSFTITCTPNGAAHTVWGAGTYTDDSSICTAAVQSGVITFATGGPVKYVIAAGQSTYNAGVANGVTSQSYGSWDGSFTLPDAKNVSFSVSPQSWQTNMTSYSGQNGKKVTIQCSTNGTPGDVWGSGPFTDDSSVCTAAVFAGLITTASGGTVIAQVAPGESSYTGSTKNGITTQDYGSWGSSFTFPSDQKTS